MSISDSKKRLAFDVLAVVQATLIAAISLVSIGLPAIQRELGLDEAQLTLVAAGYGLAFCGLLILGGRLGDVYGPGRAFTVGLSLFGLASLGGAVATSATLLLTARFAQGIGASLAAPAALTLAGNLYDDPATRSRALAAWGGLSVSGAVAGMLLSGVIVARLGWRWVFAPPILVSLTALAVLVWLYPSAPLRSGTAAPGRALSVRARPPLDVIGAALVTTGLSAVSYGLLALSRDGGPAAWTLLAAGAMLLAAFLRVEANAPHPLIPLSFFRGRQRLLALAAILLASAASAATNFFLSLYLQQARGLTPLATSAYFLPMLLITVTAGATGRWIQRSGPFPVTAVGLGTTALALVLLGAGVEQDLPAALWPGLVVFPLGLGFAFAGSVVAALAGVRDRERGVAGGVVNTAMEVGPTVGLAALVALSSARATALAQGGATQAGAMAGGYALALYAAAALMGLAGAAWTVAGMQKHTEGSNHAEI